MAEAASETETRTAVPERGRWAALGLLAGIAVTLLFAAEWLFFVTKPSFLSELPVRSKVLVLLLSPLLPLVGVVAIVGILALLARLLRPASGALFRIALLLPALAGAFTLLLLATNFTHTVFGFGIRTSGGVARVVWLLVMIGFLVWSYRTAARLAEGVAGRVPGRRLRLAAVIAAVLVVGAAAVLFFSRRQAFVLPPSVAAESLPDILLIGGDGIDASHVSLYGYARKTTPNIDALARESLVARNAFPNAENTGASTISILTGKLPTDNGLIYPPDILSGDDRYEHLPGILRDLGYHTAQFTLRHYADALDMNMSRGFDEANFRRAADDRLSDALQATIGGNAAYFVGQTVDRVRDRVLHLLWIRSMTDVYAAVTEKKGVSLGDLENIQGVEKLIRGSRQPIFAHLHLLGTHGPLFYPARRQFSEGEKQSAAWMTDFYDDALLEFDAHVGRLLAALRERGRLDNAIVVIYSDHGKKYETTSRVPLVIRFPRGEHRGAVVENVQGIDIAPTLLDHLGVGKPAWMSGASLLRPLDPCRPILGIRSDPKDHRLEDGLWQAAGGAGTARIGSVSVVVCDRVLVAKRDGTVEGRVRGHEGSCEACAPDPKAMHARALDLLATRKQEVTAPAAPPAGISEADVKGTSIAVFRPAERRFHLIRSVAARKDVLRYPAGEFEDLPVAGDWDGNGRDELGLYRPSTSTFYLFPANDQPDAATVVPFGMPGDLPLSGDWDGDGVFSVGVFRPSTATFHLRDDDSDQSVAVTFGTPEDLPVVGDWNGDGTWTIGVFRPSMAMFYLRDANETGMADRSIAFGTADDVPMVGDWNGDRKTDLGVFRASLSVFFLSTRGGGIADITVPFGAPGDRPVVGRW